MADPMRSVPNPSEAYRKVDLDARIEGSDPKQLTLICLERVRDSLAQAIIADRQNEKRARQDALAAAHRVLVGLLRAIDPANPLAEALGTVYRIALRRIERAMREFDHTSVTIARNDMEELLAGFRNI